MTIDLTREMSKFINDSELLSREEYFKLLIAIEMETIRDAVHREGFSIINELLKAVLEKDFSNDQIFALSKMALSPEIEEPERLVQDILSRAAVISFTGPSLPDREIIEIIKALKEDESSIAFLYAFIEEDSPVLIRHPVVLTKRSAQLQYLIEIADLTNFSFDHLLQVVRNAIKTRFKATPEKVIHFLNEEGENKSLGLVPATAAAIVSSAVKRDPATAITAVSTVTKGIKEIGSFIGGLFKKKKKKNPPPPPPPAPTLNEIDSISPRSNITNDPEYSVRIGNDLPFRVTGSLVTVGGSSGGSGDGGEFTKFITSPLGIAASIAGIITIGGVIFLIAD